MPTVSTLTLVFRGLMVFHEDKANKLMEIGILTAAEHIPRLLTITNGVLAKSFDLRPKINPLKPHWRLEVKNPQTTAITIRTAVANFNRAAAGSDAQFNDDFRWIMDLEGPEFYNRDLTADLKHTELLFPIMKIPFGEFYTKLKGPVLDRTPSPDDFGSIAAVIGCDISYRTTGSAPIGKEVIAELKSDEATVFSFLNKANTIFEITNTPPDVIVDDSMAHDHSDDARTMAVATMDHFHHYYSLFDPQPSVKFSFSEADPDPDPEPTLCGVTILGTRGGPLG